jgi:hypothetical protein
MLVTRREFLQLILGTAPAVALSGPLSALWPAEAVARPVAEPVILYLDREYYPCHAFLVDDLDPEKPAYEYYPPRREYFWMDERTPEERLEFWHERWEDEAPLQEFYGEIPPAERWTAQQLAELGAFESEQQAWINEEVDLDEMSSRDLAFMTRFGPGIELYDALGRKRAKKLGIHEAYFGGIASDGYGIAFRGDVDKLNATLAGLGINVVVREASYENGEWGEDDSGEEDEQLPQGMA